MAPQPTSGGCNPCMRSVIYLSIYEKFSTYRELPLGVDLSIYEKFSTYRELPLGVDLSIYEEGENCNTGYRGG